MRVFKFGGASVKDAASVKNVAKIIQNHHGTDPLVIVLSAMGKTTNALERLCALYMSDDREAMTNAFENIKSMHATIARELFPGPSHPIFNTLEQAFYQLYYYITESPGGDYNYEYDRIVSTGEMVSTLILSAYLKDAGLDNQWFAAQKLIITDAGFRDAKVDWIATSRKIKEQLTPFLKNNDKKGKPQLVITQGFLGGTPQGFTTTLGREGSDYSAAILGYALNASEVVIWKDVPGLLNGDPKIFRNTVLLENISYQEAIELAYYGATVIHPKTLKPLSSKNIPLKVKSFTQPGLPGSLINDNDQNDDQIPSYIFKFNQVLVWLYPEDFSFIAEDNLSRIFADFARHGVKINLMQHTAISFSACFDTDKTKTPALMRDLEKNFNTKHMSGLELITVRHYTRSTIDELIRGREILMEQKSRTTLQVVVAPDLSGK